MKLGNKIEQRREFNHPVPKPPKGYYRITRSYRKIGDIAYSFVRKTWEIADGWIDEPVKGFPFFFWPTARRYKKFK